MKSSLEIRIELAQLGWNTEDRLSDFGWGMNGNRGYSAWVERWEWHGVNLGVKVCFGSSVHPENLTPENINKAWKECFDIATEAWRKFPDSIPTTTASGELIKDLFMTRTLISVHKENPWLALQKGPQ